jgi:SAM-dependent methyltransferase
MNHMSEHLEFLINNAQLKPSDSVLDLGCGKLYLAAVIQYLDKGKYYGVDANAAVVYGIGNVHKYFSAYEYERCAFGKIKKGGLLSKTPTFWLSDNFEFFPIREKINVIFCKDVWTHFDPATVRQCISNCKKILHPNGVMFATFALQSPQAETNYSEGPERAPRFRTFARYNLEYLKSIIISEGMQCEYIERGIIQMLTKPKPTMKIFFPKIK